MVKTATTPSALSRRTLFACAGAVAVSSLFLAPSLVGAQEITEESYDKWLAMVREAAEKLAEDVDAKPDAEANEEFDERAKETLEDKGYKIVRPNPPTGLTVQ